MLLSSSFDSFQLLLQVSDSCSYVSRLMQYCSRAFRQPKSLIDYSLFEWSFKLNQIKLVLNQIGHQLVILALIQRGFDAVVSSLIGSKSQIKLTQPTLEVWTFFQRVEWLWYACGDHDFQLGQFNLGGHWLCWPDFELNMKIIITLSLTRIDIQIRILELPALELRVLLSLTILAW